MFHTAVAQPAWTAAELKQRRIERRAVEAAMWGMPIVSVDAMREAFFRDAGAKYGDILYFSKPADWKFQTTTPNASSLYVYFNFNTKDEPVVLEFPAAIGAGLFGTLLDAWQTPLVDVGPKGEDEGKGGKYLLLPPDFKGEVPAGYIPVRAATYNGYALFRAIPATQSEVDVAKAIALMKQLRLYPLAKATDPPEQRFIDIAGKPFDGIVSCDESFFVRLARMLSEESVQQRDLVMMGQLRCGRRLRKRTRDSSKRCSKAVRRGGQECNGVLTRQSAGQRFFSEEIVPLKGGTAICPLRNKIIAWLPLTIAWYQDSQVSCVSRCEKKIPSQIVSSKWSLLVPRMSRGTGRLSLRKK
jgi:hypothetical protein